MFSRDKNLEDIIINEFSGLPIGSIQIKSNNFLKAHENIRRYLNEFLLNEPEWETIKHIIYGVLFNIDLKRCIECGKTLSYSKSIKDGKYCSTDCCLHSKSFRESVKNSLMEKYGVDNFNKIEGIKNKSRETYYKNRTESSLKRRNEKRLNTIIEKYGSVDNFRKIADEKRKQTMIKTKGTEFSFQAADVKEKINKTLNERYADENGSLKKYYADLREKRNKNFFEQTGFRSIELKKGWETILSWKDYIIPMFSKDEYNGKDKKYIYKWKCAKCGNEFESRIYCTGHLKEINGFIPRCLKCYPLFNSTSKKEKELLDFCRTFFPNASKTRKLIYPYEIDILIEELKLFLEFNGHWYHSLENNMKKGKHLMKTLKCNEKGYRLIHIWEDEWDSNKDDILVRLEKIFRRRRIFGVFC